MVAIFVVSLIIAFILLDVVTERLLVERLRPIPSPQGFQGPTPSSLLLSLQARPFTPPQGIFFHPGHTWAHLLPSGEVKVGADEFAAKVLGRIDQIHLPEVGEKVKQGEGIFTIRQGERRATFHAPISGMIMSVNPRLIGDPEALKKETYHEGWVVVMKPAALAREIKGLVIAEEATRWLKREVSRFVEFVVGHLTPDQLLGPTLADGGLLVDRPLEKMGDDAWRWFQQEFLKGGA